MAKIAQTQDELLGHLAEQIKFLTNSSKSFDNGFLCEAKRIATVIRVLLYDNPNPKSDSISLLTQLDKKNIGFYDTASDINLSLRGFMSQWGLFALWVTRGQYIAPLDNLPPDRLKRKVSFDEWWDKIVLMDYAGNTFTRCRFIRTLADKEGGAHVDPELAEDYVNLIKHNSMGLKFVTHIGGITRETEMGNPVLHSVRQIAHEVIKTLRDEFHAVFPCDLCDASPGITPKGM